MFNWTLIKRNFRQVRTIYIVLLIVAVVFLALTTWSVNEINSIQSSKSAGVSVDQYLTTYRTMFYGTFGAIIYVIIAVLIPIFMLTSEIDNTSLAITLVSNNSRTKILFNKMFTMFLMQIIALLAETIIGVVFISFEAPNGDHIIAKFINMNSSYWMGSLVLMFITFLAASYFNKKAWVWIVGIGALLLSIILPMIGSIVKVDGLNYLSVFGFYVEKYVLENSALSAIGFVVGPIITIGLATGSIYSFKNRSLQL